MRLKKHLDQMLPTYLSSEDRTGEIEIEVIEPEGNEMIRVNGKLFHLQSGKRKIPLGIFAEKENEIKVFSKNTWYVVEGIVKKGQHLELSASHVFATITTLLMETACLEEKTKDLEKRVKRLETLCSGEKFL